MAEGKKDPLPLYVRLSLRGEIDDGQRLSLDGLAGVLGTRDPTPMRVSNNF